eukprot:CAMPEP_0119125556 /NCGR_PEP_ID=MMETSP1310-20130426/4790_1 /TAXON_ID=464262 /ORGANISM="Genus nov. species nov., Strain RCC2339" /LENGTH=58 /DNA_ID=CAMNT_0007115633 /DNA_START=78 /DNA_END=251 /DNA_ORIENTATION=-
MSVDEETRERLGLECSPCPLSHRGAPHCYLVNIPLLPSLFHPGTPLYERVQLAFAERV